MRKLYRWTYLQHTEWSGRILFVNDVSEYRRVSTITHSVSIMMLGIVASNMKKNVSGLVWLGLHANLNRLQRSFRDGGSSMGQEDQKEIRSLVGEPAHTTKKVQDWLRRQHDLLVQIFLTPTVTRFESPWLQLVGTHWGKDLKDTPQQHRWAQGFCEPRRLNSNYESKTFPHIKIF